MVRARRRRRHARNGARRRRAPFFGRILLPGWSFRACPAGTLLPPPRGSLRARALGGLAPASGGVWLGFAFPTVTADRVCLHGRTHCRARGIAMTDTDRPLPYRAASAGASARAMARELARNERRPLLLKSGGAGLALGLASGAAFGWVVGLVLGLLLALVVGWALRGRGAASYWRHGAAGERRTGRRLDRLRRRGYVVLHDLAVPGSRANIDHVVVGPCGVGVVDSKYRRGHVRFGGRRGYLRIGNTGAPLLVKSVKWEAEEVDRALFAELGRRVPVLPVLAVHTSRSRLPHWREFVCFGVPILAAADINRWVTSLPRALSGREVAVVADAVRVRLAPHAQA